MLFKEPVDMPDKDEMTAVMEKHIGAVECFCRDKNPIQNDETMDGIKDDDMSREIQWKCQYEDALIQPSRGVLDINMGEYASGIRR